MAEEDENAVPILFELVKEIGEVVYGAAKVGLITFEHSTVVVCHLQIAKDRQRTGLARSRAWKAPILRMSS